MANNALHQLVSLCHWIGQQGWTPATSGNMSVRENEQWCYLSPSGKDKGQLTVDDFLRVEIATNRVPTGGTPSAETALHTLIYRLYPPAQAVLHVHTVNATVLSQQLNQSECQFTGYEIQKALDGQQTHQATIRLPIFANQQDISQLAKQIEAAAAQVSLRYGFLLRGHGLTCWGRSVAEARRHLEALEFLFACQCRQLFGGYA